MITISEDIKNGRRWVNREIGKLDPNEDYATIMSMIAQYQMDEFTLNFLVTILTSYVVKPAHMGETLILTNKAMRRPNQRMQAVSYTHLPSPRDISGSRMPSSA